MADAAPVTLPALLAARAAAWPDHGYLWLEDGEGPEQRLGFADLRRRVEAAAAALGVRADRGDRVLVMVEPGLDYTVAILAVASAGLIAVPVYPPDPANHMMGLAQVKAILEDSRPALGLTTSRLAPLLDAAGKMEPEIAGLAWVELRALEAEAARAVSMAAVGPDDVAVLLYTSGSTGAPKGVMLSHANLVETAAAMALDCRLEPDAVICAWIPGYHVSGLFGGIVLPLWAGASVVGFPPRAFAERPRRWLEAIARYRAVMSGAPTFAYDVCARAIPPADVATLDLSCWEIAVVGGEAIRPEVMDGFVDRFGPAGFRREAIYSMFGQTEAAMITTGAGRLEGAPRLRLDADALRDGGAVVAGEGALATRTLLGSGRPLNGMGFAIVDPQTREALPDGRVGEIWLRGPGRGLGYWGRPEATRETFRVETADGQGGYLRSGDLGFRWDDQVYVAGRTKEVIIVRGLKFYPEDIEATVQELEPSLAVAAFAVTGADGSERLAVAVELAQAREDRPELAGAIRQTIARRWAVHASAVVFLPPAALPRTRTGKVQRARCAALLQAGEWSPEGGVLAAGADGIDADRGGRSRLAGLGDAEFAERVPGELAAMLAFRFGVPQSQIMPTRALDDFGVDSMAIVQLGLDISAVFGAQVSLEELRGRTTVGELAALIRARREAPRAQGEAWQQNRALRAAIRAAAALVSRPDLSGMEHLPRHGPAILVCNHVNVLDAVLLVEALPDVWPNLVASAHLGRRPLTDLLLRALYRPLYVDLDMATSFGEAVQALDRGELVCIAPEGRLNPSGEMTAGKPGAAFLAAVSGAPVTPLAISGHAGWLRRAGGPFGLRTRIACGPPMSLSGVAESDLERNTDQIMRAIARLLPPAYRGVYAGDGQDPLARAA